MIKEFGHMLDCTERYAKIGRLIDELDGIIKEIDNGQS